jgi:hypothetical protein
MSDTVKGQDLPTCEISGQLFGYPMTVTVAAHVELPEGAAIAVPLKSVAPAGGRLVVELDPEPVRAAIEARHTRGERWTG